MDPMQLKIPPDLEGRARAMYEQDAAMIVTVSDDGKTEEFRRESWDEFCERKPFDAYLYRMMVCWEYTKEVDNVEGAH